MEPTPPTRNAATPDEAIGNLIAAVNNGDNSAYQACVCASARALMARIDAQMAAALAAMQGDPVVHSQTQTLAVAAVERLGRKPCEDGSIEFPVRMTMRPDGGGAATPPVETSLFAVREGAGWTIMPAELRQLDPASLAAMAAAPVEAFVTAMRDMFTAQAQATGRVDAPATAKLSLEKTPPAPPSERRVSFRAGFLNRLDALRKDLQPLVAANPALSQFQMILSMLDAFEMMTQDGRVPDEDDRGQAGPVLPWLRQCVPLSGPEFGPLLERFEALAREFENWPTNETEAERAGEEEDEAEPVHAEEFADFESFVAALHSATAAVEKVQKDAAKLARSGADEARRRVDILRKVGRSLDKMRDQLKDAFREGRLPDAEARAESRIGPKTVAKLREDSSGAVRELASRMAGIGRWFRKWPPAPSASGELTDLNQFVIALHGSLADCRRMREIFSEDEGLRRIDDQLESMARDAAEWVDKLTPPTSRDRSAVRLSAAAADRLALAACPEFEAFRRRAEAVTQAMENWPPKSMPDFLGQLYEASLDAKLIAARTGCEALTDLDRELDIIIYRTANGREYADHERRQGRYTEYERKTLGIFEVDGFTGFLSRLNQLQAFYQTWQPPARPDWQDVPADSEPEYRSPPGADDAEERAMTEAGGLDENYFRHLLDSAARHFSSAPLRSRVCRDIGLQIRAIRRRLAEGRPPTGPEMHAVRRTFRAACVAAGAGESCGHQNEMRYACSVLAYTLRQPADAADGESDPDVRGSAARTLPAPSKPAPQSPGGMIGSPEEYADTLAGTIADGECLMALAPAEPKFADFVRQLRRMRQAAEFGRSLSNAEREEVLRGLAGVGRLANTPFSDVPDFAEDFNERVRRLTNYFTGKRVDSIEAFTQMLNATLAEAREALARECLSFSNGRMLRLGDNDLRRLGAIERQLRAMRRWSAGGRCPTEEERASTDDALAKVTELERAEDMAEFVRRVKELKQAFADWHQSADGENPPTPAIDIRSREDFDRVLEETTRDAVQLSARPLMAKPTGSQAFWDSIKKPLQKMAKFLEPGKKRSQRECEEIHAVLASVAVEGDNPCPSIHDFRADIVGRLCALNARFREILSAPPYAEAEIRAVDTTSLRQVVLGGERRMAFVRPDGPQPGLQVCRWEKSHTDVPAGELNLSVSEYLPTSDGLVTLVPFAGREPIDVSWSPHNDYVAYRLDGGGTPEGRSEIGWCNSREVGELGRVPGDAFTWTSKGNSLVIADSTNKVVSRLNIRTREALDLVPYRDDGDPAFPPQLAVSPGGDRLVFTCRRAKDAVSEIWVIEFAGSQPTARMLKRFPRAAVRTFPFWSPNGAPACLAVDADRKTTEISLLPLSDGARGETLWQSDTAEPGVTPSWSPTGRWIAFLRADGLMLLDCDSREVVPVPVGGIRGTPAFGDETILVQGGSAAHSIWLRNLPQRRKPVEKF